MYQERLIRRNFINNGVEIFKRIILETTYKMLVSKQMNTKFKFSSLSIVVLLLLGPYIGVPIAFAQITSVSSKLQAADDAVNQAFGAILDAEKVGANVTDLLNQLNTAEGYLAQADNLYRTGDSNTAATKADSVLSIAQQVRYEAQTAKQNAIVSSQNTFWLTITFTIIGIVMLIEVLCLVWLWLKRRYIKKLYEAKPEVTVNEAQ